MVKTEPNGLPPNEREAEGSVLEALDITLADSGMHARDVLQSTDLLAGTSVPRGLLAGLRGALKI